MRTSARRPTATAPDHCRALCGAWPASPRCDARASRAEWARHHSHDRRARRPAGIGVGRVRLAEAESNRPTRGFLRVVPIGSGQADRERDPLCITDQMPFTPALGAVSRIRASQRPATDRTDGTTVHDGARPIDVTAAREPVQEREVHQTPDAFLLPIAQASPTGHPDPQPSSFGNICHGIPLRRTKRMPVRQARSEMRGRPPFGRGGRTGRSGSMRSHSASGSRTAAITGGPYCVQTKASMAPSSVLLRVERATGS